jgi:hypothetical protein
VTNDPANNPLQLLHRLGFSDPKTSWQSFTMKGSELRKRTASAEQQGSRKESSFLLNEAADGCTEEGCS